MPDTEVKDKYWIKPGIAVLHVDVEGFKIYVDRIVKKKNKMGHSFTKGIQCHWLDGDGKYQTGMFHTTELKPFKK